MAGVRVADARQQIGEHVSAVIHRAFVRQAEEEARSRFVYRPWPDSTNPGHNPTVAPEVPTAIVDNRRSYTGDNTSIFTYKVEGGDPPYLILHVTSDWLRRVVRPGYALIDGRPVVEILDESDDGLPTRIKALELYAHFDPTIHGWRAGGFDRVYVVEWAGGVPTITLESAAAIEPDDADDPEDQR